jgi:hypothetical protein
MVGDVFQQALRRRWIDQPGFDVPRSRTALPEWPIRNAPLNDIINVACSGAFWTFLRCTQLNQ